MHHYHYTSNSEHIMGQYFRKFLMWLFGIRIRMQFFPLFSPIITEADTKLGRKSCFNAIIWKFPPPSSGNL